MSQFTIEQHQMLEDLTGKQYTRAGRLRQNRRSLTETERLGLENFQTRFFARIRSGEPGDRADRLGQLLARLQSESVEKP